MHPEVADIIAKTISGQIPDKLYFRIGEVSRLVGIKPYVLRFWESEFPGLGPKKSETGHRLYRRKDVELVLEIKQLLYDKRYTIEGARKELVGRLKSSAKTPEGATEPARAPAPMQAELFSDTEIAGVVRRELIEILEILSCG